MLKDFGWWKKKRSSCLVHGRHGFGYRVWCAEIEPVEKDGVSYDWVTCWEGINNQLFWVLKHRMWIWPLLAGFMPKNKSENE